MRELLAYFAIQKAPVTEKQVAAHFGLKGIDAFRLGSDLLRLLDDGDLCEPIGEFNGFLITDQGRKRLAEMKPEPKKREQMSMF